MRTRTIAVYLSEHGFGHAVRSVLVLGRLLGRRPDVELRLATRLPAWLLAGLERAIRDESMALRPPLVQRDSLAVDHAASLTSLAAQDDSWAADVERHARWLERLGAALVYADIPPLPLLAAQRAGLRSVALGNFTWAWIYQRYAASDPRYGATAQRCALGDQAATRLLRLPTFPPEPLGPGHVALPWVARAPTRGAAAVRRVLGLADERPMVLLSFGGHGGLGLESLGEATWARRIHLVAGRQLAAASPGLRALDEDALAEQGVRYIDLVAAADVVVSKPGYGIVADCLSTGTRLVTLARPEFPEAPELLEPAMAQLLDSVTVPVDRRNAEGVIEAVETALGRPRPTPGVALDGVDRAVDEIEALLG